MLQYKLAHFFRALFFIFLLHPLPLGKNVFDFKLSGNLFFYFFKIGNNQAHLPVIFHTQNLFIALFAF